MSQAPTAAEGAPQAGALPYPDYLHEQTHPDHLAVVARLVGHTPPDPRGARVLELACSAGSNLLPMAVTLPRATFVGVDLAADRIAVGQGIAAGAGLGNVELRAGSITEIDEGWGSFDYVIAHGLYSWVGPEVREAVLRIAGQRLVDGGVAFISYNTWPGWCARMMGSEFMRYFGRRAPTPAAWTKGARRLLDHLVATQEGRSPAMIAGLVEERRRLKGLGDGYLNGEYNAQDHQAFFFHRFMADASAHGLTYLGESRDLSAMQPERHRPKDPAALPSFGEDVVETQQYVDFVVERYFRQTLLVKGAGGRSFGLLRPEALAELYLAAEVVPVGDVDLHSDGPATFMIQDQEVTDSRPIIKAVIATLGDHWPASLGIDALVSEARARLKWAASADEEADRRRVGAWAVEAVINRWIRADTHPWPIARIPGERPVASPLARYQATLGDEASNLRHERRTLDAAQRRMLPLVDGSRDLAQLARDYGAELPAGDWAGKAIPRGAAGIRHVLATLGRTGFLMS